MPIGADGQVCFVNAQHSSVHLVADQLGVIDADSYQPATPSGAPQRALDTRAVGVPEPPADPSDIVHGRQLTAANTGLRAAGFVYDVATDTFKHPVDGALRRSGTIRTSRDGQVIANVDVEGAIIVEHDNVTIRNCRVRYDGTVYGIDARSTSPVGTLIEYCDITHIGPEPHEAYGIFLSRGTARYLNIYGWQAGFIAGTDTRIEYSRITDLRAISGTHGTGGSADGGSNISFYRNYIEGNTSAALALYSRSPFHGVSVRENYFDASTRPSFCLNAGDNKNGTGVNTDIKVVGNVFGTTKYPECGQFGTHYRWDPTRPGAQWCDNRLSTGVPVGREVGC
ncbi:MAG TPA: right-handed parallel beta-helix repeat-containing protein [Ilumatobacter sp.]|nr:right-handed parallel beta-helix repeat-containing protein [Ilumatobacter sp.]